MGVALKCNSTTIGFIKPVLLGINSGQDFYKIKVLFFYEKGGFENGKNGKIRFRSKTKQI